MYTTYRCGCDSCTRKDCRCDKCRNEQSSCNNNCSSSCNSCCNNSCNCKNGKSAYEIALANGFVGTEAQWLASLSGKSAYQIALANGFVGTEAQWLASLSGKSAYQIALANGFVGTEAQWLESLKAAFELGQRLFGIQTDNGTLAVGYGDTMRLTSKTLSVALNPQTSAIEIESSGGLGKNDIQFVSLSDNVVLNSALDGTRGNVSLVSYGAENIASTGGAATSLIPLRSAKTVGESVLKELHVQVRNSLGQTANTTVFAQLYIGTYGGNAFTPINGTLIEVGTFAQDAPQGTILSKSLNGLSVDIPANSALMLGFYNVTSGGTVVSSISGYLSGIAHLEQK